MNMLERVARAIDPRIWAIQDGLRKNSPDVYAMRSTTEERNRSLAKARAALTALREPTEAMRKAGEMEIIVFSPHYQSHEDGAVGVFEEMIDAALAGEPGK